MAQRTGDGQRESQRVIGRGRWTGDVRSGMTDGAMHDLVRRVEALEARREIDVERINIVEGNGTVRMVLSNSSRAPDPICNGQTFTRSGGNSAGIIFYNGEGDECGGLVFSGRQVDGRHSAGAALLFDQFKQDQVVGIMHEDSGAKRRAGFWVWDRPDDAFPITGGAPRVFLGKTPERSAVVELRDGAGRVRLRLEVPADGEPRVEFLDEKGEVGGRLP